GRAMASAVSLNEQCYELLSRAILRSARHASAAKPFGRTAPSGKNIVFRLHCATPKAGRMSARHKITCPRRLALGRLSNESGNARDVDRINSRHGSENAKTIRTKFGAL